MTLQNTSKFYKNLIFITALGLISLLSSLVISGQEVEVKISVVTLSPALLHVEGKFTNSNSTLASKDWSFLQNYADASDLGSRIENLNLTGENGEKLEIKKLIAGEFQANKTPISFDYYVKIELPIWLTSAAHVSWVSGDYGLVMLNDLLPQWKSESPIPAKISLKVPFGWKITSSETVNNEGVYEVKNVEKAIFLVGKNWREKNVKVDKTELNLAISGEWQFSDDEAAEMAGSILEEHRKTFGEIPIPKAQIFLLPFPKRTSSPDRWRAETRDSTVMILSGIVPLKSQALQRLHEQLRHEILHLWVPNALALSGNYDWFYEGFAIYQALRAGIQMNQIRFDDYLNTLSQAYNMSQNQNASLIKMSNNRWMGGNNSVYAKGMIVAFLCDAALLRESKGKSSVTDIFRQVYQKHRFPNAVENGNTAILSILKGYPELLPLIQNYIKGSAKIDWQEELNNFGLEAVNNNSSTELKVLSKISNKQKDLLDKLGYNQWRKLLQKTK